MSILFAGGEIEDFDVGAAVVVHGGSWDADYARTAVAIQGGTSGTNQIEAPFSASSEVWVGAYVALAHFANVSGRVLLELQSSTGAICQLCGSGTNNTLNFRRWNGSSWTTIGSIDFTGLNRFTMRAKIAVSGVIALYKNGSLAYEFTGDTSALGDGDTLILGSPGSATSRYSYISEVIVADHVILLARLKTLALTGAGTNSDWDGAVTDINPVIADDLTFVSSDTATEKSTFAASDLPASDLVVEAVKVTTRAKKGETGQTDIDALVRVGGTDYGQSIGPDDVAAGNHASYWHTSPATAAPWTRSEVDAVEIGVRSVA